jgi:hypothetical protein
VSIPARENNLNETDTISVTNHTGGDVFSAVYVDGHQVDGGGTRHGTFIRAGSTKTIDGFEEDGVVKEFLFALPRFARSEDDRVKKDR